MGYGPPRETRTIAIVTKIKKDNHANSKRVFQSQHSTSNNLAVSNTIFKSLGTQQRVKNMEYRGYTIKAEVRTYDEWSLDSEGNCEDWQNELEGFTVVAYHFYGEGADHFSQDTSELDGDDIRALVDEHIEEVRKTVQDLDDEGFPFCPYNPQDKVLPDENDLCSLCGRHSASKTYFDIDRQEQRWFNLAQLKTENSVGVA